MKLEVSQCPKCAKPAVAVWEMVPVKTGLVQGEDGEYDWDSDELSQPFWDASEIEMDEGGRAEVLCENGHEWKTKILRDESEVDQGV